MTRPLYADRETWARAAGLPETPGWPFVARWAAEASGYDVRVHYPGPVLELPDVATLYAVVAEWLLLGWPGLVGNRRGPW